MEMMVIFGGEKKGYYTGLVRKPFGVVALVRLIGYI